MNSGPAYEADVAKIVRDEIDKGAFGLDPKLATVRLKPKYYSRDRAKEITFDVSVEVRRAGAADPFWVWVWECKNYGHSVPVDDVEEFHAKLAQIGADRTKGTMITPVGFDAGGVEYAKSKGIGLWRYVPKGSPMCMMDDDGGTRDSIVMKGLTTADTNRLDFNGFFYGLQCDGSLTLAHAALLKSEIAEALKS